MADVAVSNTFVANTVISSSAMNINFSDLVTYINNRNTGSATWDAIRVTTASAVPLVANNSSGSSNIANFQDNGTNVLSIADGGATTMTATAGGSSIPLTVDNSTSTGSILVAKDNGSAVFTIADGGAITTTGAVTVGGALTVTGATTLNGAITLAGAVTVSQNKRRPNLTYISTTAIDVESNTGTANQTSITFPDGNTRSVTEDTAATHKYRRFLITATAEFTSGTEDSGLRNGLTEAASTWYAVYAVKSAINTANFVLVGDTTLPLQANFATLDAAYGSNGWLYLGLIRNNGSSNLTTFVQSGHVVCGNGIVLASATASSVTYTYSAGTGATDLPGNISVAYWRGKLANGATTRVDFTDSAAATEYGQLATGNNDTSYLWWSPAADGAKLSNTGAASVASTITILAYVDSALGVPQGTTI